LPSRVRARRLDGSTETPKKGGQLCFLAQSREMFIASVKITRNTLSSTRFILSVVFVYIFNALATHIYFKRTIVATGAEQS